MSERHPGLSPAFDLSRWSYFLDFALVPVASIALLAIASLNKFSAIGIVVAVTAGAVTWSLAEYWIHRLVFHGDTPFEADARDASPAAKGT